MTYSHVNAKGQTYFLHGKDVTLKNGRRQRIYFFAKQPRDKDTVEVMPDGFEVTENDKTGLPVLRRVKPPA